MKQIIQCQLFSVNIIINLNYLYKKESQKYKQSTAMKQQPKKAETIQGKKINNFMSFRTKDTIYLSNNLPQLIIHEHAFQTDNSAFKQLLSKRSSSRLSKDKKDREKQNLKENLFFHNLIRKVDVDQEGETRRFRLKTSKEKQENNTYNSNSKQKTKSKTKSKKKLTKKTKSMVRIIPNNQNLYGNELPTKRKLRKSCSPTNYNNQSQSKKNIILKQQLPTSFAKSTKFTQSKQQTTKRLKSKHDQGEEKSKQKLKPKHHLKSQQKVSKKRSKKINSSSSKANLLSFDQPKTTVRNPLKKIVQKPQIKQKPTKSKQRKQKTAVDPIKKKSKSKLISTGQVQSHFQSANDNFNFNIHPNEQKSLLNKYSSNRDSLPYDPKKHKKKQRNSLKLTSNGNSNTANDFKRKKSQKKCIISSDHIGQFKIQNQAAIKIQKVYKGYVTRKWLKQYLILIHATVTIQRFWRGYQCRKKFKQMKTQKQKSMIKMIKKNRPKLQLIQQQLLLQSQDGRSSINKRQQKSSINSHNSQKSHNNQHLSYQQSQNFEQLKDILFEVMDEQSVDAKIRSRIKAFLEKQQLSSRHSIKSNISKSQGRLSSQRLKQEIQSEKKFFQKKQSKKEQKSSYNQNIAPIQPNSPNYFSSKVSNSPYKELQSYGSPKNGSFSPLLSKSFRSSSDVLNNLYQIQAFHRQKLVQTASKRKQQLNSMLQNMVVSPRTHKLKQDQVEQKLASQLSKFEASISEVMQSCKKSQQQDAQIIRPMMITPQHISLRSPVEPYQIKQQRKQYFQQLQRLQTIKHNQQPLQKYRFNFDAIVQNQSIQVQNVGLQVQVQVQGLGASIKRLGQQGQKQSNIQKIDNTYSFVDEYLLTMIQFLRNKNNGEVMHQIVQNIKTFKTLSPQLVLRNLSLVPQEDELDDAFALPLYKYLDDDKQLINENYLLQFQKYFKMQQIIADERSQDQMSMEGSSNLNGTGSSPLLQKTKNSPVKSNRKNYQSQISQYYLKLLQDSFNQALNTKRPSSYIFTQRSLTTVNNIKRIAQQQVDVQCQYQIYCANAMLDIFCWFGIKYGFGMDDEQLTLQSKQYNEEAIKKILKVQAQKNWDQYYQLIEIIASLSDQIWAQIAFQQTYSIQRILAFR